MKRAFVFPGQGSQVVGMGKGLTKSFTIRKMSGIIGVERIFPLNMPTLQKIEINKKGKVRKSRIFYFRKLRGKKAKINIRKEPKINLIKWFLAHGSQSPPAAEYNDATPTKPNKITHKIIIQSM